MWALEHKLTSVQEDKQGRRADEGINLPSGVMDRGSVGDAISCIVRSSAPCSPALATYSYAEQPAPFFLQQKDTHVGVNMSETKRNRPALNNILRRKVSNI